MKKRNWLLWVMIILLPAVMVGQSRRVIGIIPFGNKVENDRYGWLSRGIEEILYDKLKSVSSYLVYEKETLDRHLKNFEIANGLQVEAREAFKIGKVTGIEVIVTGDYEVTSEEQLILHVKFINTYTGSRIYDETYSSSVSRLFDVFKIIVEKLVEITQVEVSEAERQYFGVPITRSIEAFKYYCQAYQELEKGNSRMEVVAGLFNRALREDPDFWEAQYNMGVIYYSYRFFDRAIDQFNKVIQRNPGFYKPYFGRGVIYYMQKKYRDAIRDFERVLELKKDDDRSLFYLGSIYSKINELNKAIDLLNRSIAINPDYAPAYYQLGLAFRKAGRYKSGIKVLRQAIDLDPGLAEAHNVLGECYYRINMFDEALNEFDTAIQLRPDFSTAYFNKANTIYKKNSLQEIVSAYLELIETVSEEEPNQASSPSARRELMMQENEGKLSEQARKVYQEMIHAYRKAIMNDPRFYEAAFNLALTYDNIGNVDSAYFFYRISLDINPMLARAHLRIARIYEKQKDYQQALQEYKEVVKTDPTFFTMNPTLGEAYRYVNIIEETIQDLQQALKSNPNDISALKALGRIYYHLGKYSQARQIFENVLKISATDEEAAWYMDKIKKI